MRSGEAPQGLADRILTLLGGVPDPEIPAVSVIDLGIVRRVDEVRRIVEITPTYTGCPATVAIEGSIRRALDDAGFQDFAITTVLTPPWTTDWISDEGREKLRKYGVAPPARGAAAGSLKEPSVECPQCGSSHTQEISRFGSTPCKSLCRCLSCAEPFDRFKCH